MNAATIRNVKQILDDLENGSSRSERPADAERRLSDAVRPILESQGWGVVWTDEAHENEIDIIGTKLAAIDGEKERTLGVELRLTPEPFLEASVVRRMVGAAAEGGLDDYLLVSNRKPTGQAAQVLRQAGAMKLAFADFHDLRSWIARIERELAVAPMRVTTAVQTMVRELARAVSDEPGVFRTIVWPDVERMIATILADLGFAVVHTRLSQDGGKDIIVEIKDTAEPKTYIIEIKHWSCGKRVQGKHLAYFLSVVANEKHESGLFLSTSGYAGNAFEAIATMEHNRLHLGGEDKIVTLCKTYAKSHEGLWNTPSALAEIFFEGTLRAEILKSKE